MVRFSAQVDVISIVMISGILLALVGAAYLWGVPIVEKRSTLTQFQIAQDWLDKLNKAITDVANSGGRTDLDIPFGIVSIIPIDSQTQNNNTIVFEFVIPQPLIWNVSQVYFGQTTDVLNEIGRYGIAQPYILTLNSTRVDTQTKIAANLHYRELAGDGKSYKIALIGSGQGKSKITINYKNITKLAGSAANGGDLFLTYIAISLA
jgi:hypothetical protein